MRIIHTHTSIQPIHTAGAIPMRARRVSGLCMHCRCTAAATASFWRWRKRRGKATPSHEARHATACLLERWAPKTAWFQCFGSVWAEKDGFCHQFGSRLAVPLVFHKRVPTESTSNVSLHIFLTSGRGESAVSFCDSCLLTNAAMSSPHCGWLAGWLGDKRYGDATGTTPSEVSHAVPATLQSSPHTCHRPFQPSSLTPRASNAEASNPAWHGEVARNFKETTPIPFATRRARTRHMRCHAGKRCLTIVEKGGLLDIPSAPVHVPATSPAPGFHPALFLKARQGKKKREQVHRALLSFFWVRAPL